jgi:leader peptidase (prepilin peptidase)/N-methyltransferase
VVFLSLLIPVIFIDWDHYLIPDQILLSGTILWFLVALIPGRGILLYGLISGVLTSGVLLLILLMGQLFLGKPALGFGDVKLAGVIGLFMGWEYSLLNIWFAAIFAMVCGFIRMTDKTRRSTGIKLPFGSFLGASAIVIYLMRDEIASLFHRWLTQH